jgi:hypothetical protein
VTASRPWLGISTPSWLIKSDTPHRRAGAPALARPAAGRCPGLSARLAGRHPPARWPPGRGPPPARGAAAGGRQPRPPAPLPASPVAGAGRDRADRPGGSPGSRGARAFLAGRRPRGRAGRGVVAALPGPGGTRVCGGVRGRGRGVAGSGHAVRPGERAGAVRAAGLGGAGHVPAGLAVVAAPPGPPGRARPAASRSRPGDRGIRGELRRPGPARGRHLADLPPRDQRRPRLHREPDPGQAHPGGVHPAAASPLVRARAAGHRAQPARAGADARRQCGRARPRPPGPTQQPGSR